MSGAPTDTSHQTYRPSGDIFILVTYLTRKANELRSNKNSIYSKDFVS